jgi:hypothetical protein
MTPAEAVAQALEFTDRDELGHWYFTNLGQFQGVVRQTDDMSPADQQEFTRLLEEALQ